jgi:hypothetical protein
MDAQESVIEMRRDEPAALEEAAVFSRHRPVAVGCVGLTGFRSLVFLLELFDLKRQPEPSACHIVQGGSQRAESGSSW